MVLCFENIEIAQSEYARIGNLLERRQDRKNDLPPTISLQGINSFSCPLNDITGIGLVDLVKQNAEEHGVRDAYPNLFKR